MLTQLADAIATIRDRIAAMPRIEGNAQHRYLVEGYPSESRDKRWPSVTTILGATVPKPGLAVWRERIAFEKALRALHAHVGNIVAPEWAEEVIAEARALPDTIAAEAADWGTGCHQAIADSMAGREYDVETYGSAVQAVTRWLTASGLEVVATELPLWHQAGYAGTMDTLCFQKMTGQLVVLDYKTVEAPNVARTPYAENALQLAAYAAALEPHMKAPERGYVLRLPRTPPEPGEPVMVAHLVLEIDRHLDTFLNLLHIYQAQRKQSFGEPEPLLLATGLEE